MLELFIGLSIDFILVKSWWFDKAKSHNLQILQHNHSIHKHKSKHWQCCVRDLTGCAQRAHQIALHQFNNFDNFNSYNC